MQEEGIILKDTVEVDETYWYSPGKNKRRKPFFGQGEQQIIMGFLERDGKIITRHMPDTAKITMINAVQKYVPLDVDLYTDQHPNYNTLYKYGYKHDYVVHQREFVKKGNPIVHTQGIESYWSQLKRGLRGVYRRPSKKHLQAYLNEYSWRFNHRHEDMFPALLHAIATPKEA